MASTAAPADDSVPDFQARCGSRGAGGSIPSMVAYVFGVIGIFRLTRGALSRSAQPDSPPASPHGSAALIFAANPNLIYMQSTAMGEVPLPRALHLGGSLLQRIRSRRWQCPHASAASAWRQPASPATTDGFLPCAMAAFVLLQFLLSANSANNSQPDPVISKAAVVKFILIAAAAPALWLAYNGIRLSQSAGVRKWPLLCQSNRTQNPDCRQSRPSRQRQSMCSPECIF